MIFSFDPTSVTDADDEAFALASQAMEANLRHEAALVAF